VFWCDEVVLATLGHFKFNHLGLLIKKKKKVQSVRTLFLFFIINSHFIRRAEGCNPSTHEI
jgi:hypothetical protein